MLYTFAFSPAPWDPRLRCPRFPYRLHAPRTGPLWRIQHCRDAPILLTVVRHVLPEVQGTNRFPHEVLGPSISNQAASGVVMAHNTLFPLWETIVIFRRHQLKILGMGGIEFMTTPGNYFSVWAGDSKGGLHWRWLLFMNQSFSS